MLKKYLCAFPNNTSEAEKIFVFEKNKNYNKTIYLFFIYAKDLRRFIKTKSKDELNEYLSYLTFDERNNFNTFVNIKNATDNIGIGLCDYTALVKKYKLSEHEILMNTDRK